MMIVGAERFASLRKMCSGVKSEKTRTRTANTMKVKSALNERSLTRNRFHFITAGGVSTANLTDYLAEKAVACVGETRIASRKAIAEKKWVQIRDNRKAAIEIVKRVMG
jgi:2-keto-3-deoxy-6-phosphogluconate aldolase